MAGNLMDAPVEIWRRTFDLYEDVFKERAQKMKKDKAKELLELDKWFQKEFPTVLSTRQEKSLTIEELVKIMQWKLMRGKFRPRLIEFVKSNKPETIIHTTAAGFKYLPDVEKAIKKLSELKGVGPATASAILCAGCPQVPFMADEAMMALPVGKGKLEYSIKAYNQYLEQIRKLCLKRLQKEDPEGEWNEHKVEITLWTHQIASKSFPELLTKTNKRQSDDANNAAIPPKKIKKS